MTIVGVDGAPGGWVAATRLGPRGYVRFADVLRDHPRAAIYVDIPIGLLDTRRGSGDRPCDKQARAALAPRRSCVFPPPRRAQLRHAGRPYRAGLGLSAQTHAILPKIREVDDALASSAGDDAPRVREAHPELAFLLAAGHAIPPKRTPEGRARRARILERAGLHFASTGLGVRASRADVDDAAALVWLGEEVDAGRVGYYGEPPLVIWGRPLQGKP